MLWTEYGYGQMAGLCVRSNGPLGFMEAREFLDSPSVC